MATVKTISLIGATEGYSGATVAVVDVDNAWAEVRDSSPGRFDSGSAAISAGNRTSPCVATPLKGLTSITVVNSGIGKTLTFNGVSGTPQANVNDESGYIDIRDPGSANPKGTISSRLKGVTSITVA